MIAQWILIAPFAIGAAFATYLAITPIGTGSQRALGAAPAQPGMPRGEAPHKRFSTRARARKIRPSQRRAAAAGVSK